MKTFLKATLMLSRWMDVIAGAVLIFIMLLTSADVILRYLRYPILGTYDTVSMGAAFVMGFAIPKTSIDKTHVTVDFLVAKLSRKGQKAFEVATRILGLVFFGLLTWNFVKMALGFLQTGDSTQTLSIPFYPIAFALGICSFAECLVLLGSIGEVVSGAVSNG